MILILMFQFDQKSWEAKEYKDSFSLYMQMCSDQSGTLAYEIQKKPRKN